ncbi:hypothetical protein L1049_022660 [Liquidambar formosana]|uniref:Uncharacterized protein n=1 Tax=Liquidambar formosana TaxID=63359 RepID=A0AAP0WQJ6_LIQFO
MKSKKFFFAWVLTKLQALTELPRLKLSSPLWKEFTTVSLGGKLVLYLKLAELLLFGLLPLPFPFTLCPLFFYPKQHVVLLMPDFTTFGGDLKEIAIDVFFSKLQTPCAFPRIREG